MKKLALIALVLAFSVRAEDKITDYQRMRSPHAFYVKNSSQVCFATIGYYKGRVEQNCHDIQSEKFDGEDTYDFYFRNQGIIAKREFEEKEGVQIVGDISQSYFLVSDGRICMEGPRRESRTGVECEPMPDQKIQKNISKIKGEEESLKNMYLFEYAKEESDTRNSSTARDLDRFKEQIKGIDSSKVIIHDVSLSGKSKKCRDIKSRSNLLGMLITIGTAGYLNFDFSRAKQTNCSIDYEIKIKYSVEDGASDEVFKNKHYSFSKLPYKNKALKKLFKKNMNDLANIHRTEVENIFCKEFRCRPSLNDEFNF